MQLSIIAYQILSNKKVVDGDDFQEIIDKVRNGSRTNFYFPISESYQKWIEKCWSQDPLNRPISDDIMHELSTNPSFITDSIDKERYQKFINFIEQSLLQSLHNCGKMYYNGILVPKSKEKTAFYFKKAAEKGHLNSMVAYSIILYNGDCVQADPIGSLRYIKEAADKGSPEAMYTYSLSLGIGDGIERNIEYYKKTIDKGHFQSLFNLASIYQQGQLVKADLKESARLFKLSADKGIAVNKKEAFKYFKLVTDKENPEGMFYYATMRKEEGKNFSEYVRYLKMAADLDNEDAMFQYANLLATGHGVPVDSQKASYYFKLLADRGNVSSMHNYAIYMKGRNDKEFARYIKMAADKNDYTSLYEYATPLINGEGVPVNMNEAVWYLYYKKAADLGDADSMLNK